jgi:hypothetical protein
MKIRKKLNLKKNEIRINKIYWLKIILEVFMKYYKNFNNEDKQLISQILARFFIGGE